ncbi:hypothetical protein GOBAR_DD19591 [Gossypium barbadense]|nr:hypothetical protein GOBAR_DD19591 [Gossypium barbadense]
MVFRAMRDWNLILLAKLGWRLMVESDALWPRVVHAKYLSSGNFLEAIKPLNCSHTWRSMLAGIEVLNKSLRCRIGNGSIAWDHKSSPVAGGKYGRHGERILSNENRKKRLIKEGYGHIGDGMCVCLQHSYKTAMERIMENPSFMEIF